MPFFFFFSLLSQHSAPERSDWQDWRLSHLVAITTNKQHRASYLCTVPLPVHIRPGWGEPISKSKGINQFFMTVQGWLLWWLSAISTNSVSRFWHRNVYLPGKYTPTNFSWPRKVLYFHPHNKCLRLLLLLSKSLKFFFLTPFCMNPQTAVTQNTQHKKYEIFQQ